MLLQWLVDAENFSDHLDWLGGLLGHANGTGTITKLGSNLNNLGVEVK